LITFLTKVLGVAKTLLEIVWIPGFERMPPGSSCLGPVLRMHRVEKRPTIQCLRSFAKVFQQFLIDEFGCTCGVRGADQARHAIDNWSNVLVI